MDGRDDFAQVAAQSDEGLPGLAEAVGDRDLGVHEALGEQVEGEHLGVVVVVDDFCGTRGRR